jgi:hypothetical protein
MEILTLSLPKKSVKKQENKLRELYNFSIFPHTAHPANTMIEILIHMIQMY